MTVETICKCGKQHATKNITVKKKNKKRAKYALKLIITT